MNRSKVLFAAVLLATVLTISNPATNIAKAAELSPTAPSIVFVQDKNNKMLVNHNFEADSKIYIPMGKDMDTGFYVTIPSEK